jgi:hypothetical protein
MFCNGICDRLKFAGIIKVTTRNGQGRYDQVSDGVVYVNFSFTLYLKIQTSVHAAGQSCEKGQG